MRKLALILLTLLQVTLSCSAEFLYIDRDKGYYIDGRNQFRPGQAAPAPNPAPIPKLTRTVAPFETYYEATYVDCGVVPNRTERIYPKWGSHFSTRRARPYTKQDFVDAWCTGEKGAHGVDCSTEEYAITFVRASNWPYGVAKAPIKALRSPKKTALFVMVDNLELDANYMREAKSWCELMGMKVFFGTIDSYIPTNWII